MKYFIVPADFKNQTIDKYIELNNRYEDSKVIETYGQITIGNNLGSGRSLDLLPKIEYLDFISYVHYSQQKGIAFNYTINAPHMNNREFTENGIQEIKEFFDDLYNAGVHSLTIALPSLIELVKSMGYNFKIKASVLCQITNANKAMSYKRQGIDRIVLDESLNRNFSEMKRIANAFGNGIEIIANAICYKDCSYRMFHYNQMAADSIKPISETSTQYYSHRCVLQRYEEISNIMKLCWVRPEDLKYYTSIGINYFKLQGRQAVLRGDPGRAVECYFRESYDGNLLELLDMFAPTNKFMVYVDNKKLDGFIKTFYEKENFCKNECTCCKYCETFARKSIDYEEANKIIDLAKKFYNGYDKYINLIEQLKSKAGEEKEDDRIDVDFEFGG